MDDKGRLFVVALISVAGLLLVLGATHIGASHAASPLLSFTLARPLVDEQNSPGAFSGRASLSGFQLSRTVTLRPALDDVMSDTWPICVQDLYYNWPGGAYVYFPADAWEVSGGTSSGPLIITSTDIPVLDQQDWMTVTYCTRTQDPKRSRAQRSENLVTLTVQAAAFRIPDLIPYEPLTATLVYTRQIPLKDGEPKGDYWGKTIAQPVSFVPTPTEQSLQEGWVRWSLSNTSAFTGMVMLREPLFGSDLTVTQFLMEPSTLELGKSNIFTVTISNIGPVTASRWFAAELYIRPEGDPPPQGPYDHAWGLITYQGDALFHKPGAPGDWPVARLAPSESVTMETLITVTGFMTGNTNYRAYAQVDTGYEGDPWHYAWYGSNPEGYGVPPYLEEQNNIAIIGPILYIPATYRLEAAPVVTNIAPPGTQAVYLIPVTNTGNVSDIYSVTFTTPGQWYSEGPPIMGPVPNWQSAFLTITVDVPPDAIDGSVDVMTITLTSQGDPSQTADVMVVTTAEWYRTYLPVVRNYKK